MKRTIAVIATLIMLFSSLPVCFAQAESAENLPEPDLTVSDAKPYSAFLQEYKNAARPAEEYAVNITEYTVDGAQAEVKNDYNGKKTPSLYMSENGKVTFKVQVAKAGLYGIRADYFAENARGAEIERKILINGQYPHDVSEKISFKRMYIDDPEGVGMKDALGNDIRPSQIKHAMWQDNYFLRDNRFSVEAMLFYFKEGENTITFEGVSEPLTLSNLVVCNESKRPTYEEVVASYKDKGYKQAQAQPIIIQAEKAQLKSDTVLYPLVDRTTPSTVPYDPHVEKLNSIGGYRWANAGQFMVWDFEVKEEGLYTICIKSRQNITRGIISHRAIYIDNVIPFREFENYGFNFNNKWQLERLGEEEAYQIYLTPGTHQIKMEVTLGSSAEQIKKVEKLLFELNSIYTTVMSITGSKPDAMRDYRLDTLIPNEIKRLGGIADELQKVVDWYKTQTNSSGQSVSALNTLIRQLRILTVEPDKIAKNLDYFKSNIGALANWMISAQQQPLELDYIALVPADTDMKELPRANAKFFQKMQFNVIQFMQSFSKDYASIGSSAEGTQEYKTIKVWTSTGRDQAQSMRKIIDSTFSAQHKINVELELVNVSALLPATVAGIGPDVALNMGEGEPLNYALRNAVIDLTQFPDFKEVSQWFLPERMVPLTFDGKVYALPETQTFNVLFYRKDILSDLGLKIPQTWEDVISVITVLNKNNMSFAVPASSTALPQAGVGTYYTMLFQQGGKLYNDNGVSSALSNEAGMAAFKQWTNLYVNYDLPKEYNFLDRFRTGEYPLIIGDFSNFNSLTVSAPEIRGMWGFTLLPGTRQEDGSIDRSMPIGGLNSFILKNSTHYDEAWEFLKWWVSADTQVAYGVEMESILGASARYATANLEAFEQIPWSNDFYKVLKAQMKWGRGVEQVPGSYFTPRHLDNAFRKVVISHKDVKDTLLDYVYIINGELTSKRQEFGLKD